MGTSGRPKMPKDKCMNERIVINCTREFKEEFYSKMRARGENISEYIRKLIEKDMKRK